MYTGGGSDVLAAYRAGFRRACRSRPQSARDSDRILFADSSPIQNGSATDHFQINFATKGEQQVSKLKLEHGISRVRRAKLQCSIDQTIAGDIELMTKWSNNETQYVVNELLRFAIAQTDDFQQYKSSSVADTSRPTVGPKSLPSLNRTASDSSPKPEAIAPGLANRA